ncbi:MAG TPA: LPS export ABC transporter periplasmic protein LptC [Nannocystis sp.]
MPRRPVALTPAILGLAVSLAAVLPAISGCSRAREPARVPGEEKPLPLTEYRDTTVLDMHEGSRLAWRLVTTSLTRWPGSELVQATPVDLSVFDSAGTLAIRVTADSGAVDEAATFLLARGNVHGVSAKDMQLFTDSLRWSKPLNQVATDADVRVISESGDTLMGRGFVSDANLDHWQILSDVRGVFQDVGRAAGEESAPDSGSP